MEPTKIEKSHISPGDYGTVNFQSGCIPCLVVTCFEGDGHITWALFIGLLLKHLQFKWAEPLSLFLVISQCRALLSARAAGKGGAGGVRMLK